LLHPKLDLFLVLIDLLRKIFTPISSTSILSRPSGPNDVRTMLAIAIAARTIYLNKKI